MPDNKTLTLEPVKEEETVQKSVMSCPLCKNTQLEIVSRCATCKVCGWSLCSA
jgi:hypothetical protein